MPSPDTLQEEDTLPRRGMPYTYLHLPSLRTIHLTHTREHGHLPTGGTTALLRWNEKDPSEE